MVRGDSGLKAEFGCVLVTYREKAGLSQEDLGFSCGLHRTYISQLERGLKSPSLTTIFALAEALGTTPTKLIAALQKRL